MKFIPEVIRRTVAHNALLAQKGSPKILFGVGVVGMVGSTVLACRATLKMDEVLDETQRKLTLARTLEHDDYSEHDRQRDISLIHFQTTVKVVRLYLPSIVLGGASIAALTYSHNILTKRNVALTAAYTALDKGFREYRARVVEKYGEEEDRHLRYGTREVAIIDPETNKDTTVTRVSINDPSVYARFFDQFSSSWSKEPEYNLFFLKCQQNYCNDLLKARGHVFLNEVYEKLGLPHTKAGAVVGWLLTRDGKTDNHIDFGVFNSGSGKARDFVNGYEGAVLLDFNVDGVIFDKIEDSTEGKAWQRY